MRIYLNNNLLWCNIRVANTFLTRFKGLMGKKQLKDGEGLLIKPCNQVHSFNMRFDIDVIYLSQCNDVLSIQTLKPNRSGKLVKGAKSVLEVTCGTAHVFGINIGDKIVMEE